MSGRVFVDTNVFVYLFDSDEPTKQDTARDLLDRLANEATIRDALILRAALESGCELLASEDMQHGRRFENLRVDNPFLLGAHGG